MSWREVLGDRVVEDGVENGIEWIVARAPLFGAHNGYVKLPLGHPWRDLELQTDPGDQGPEIHGGVTYGPDGEGWIGFDTAHAFDVWPGSPEYMQHHGEYDTHWTIDMVVQETLNLARQAAK